MTRNIWALVCLSALAFFSGCDKDEDPPTTPPTGTVEPINFGSATFGSVSDIDGNVYKTVIIGTATWMAENLKVTKFNNGDVIPKLGGGTTWTDTTTPAYYNFTDNANMITLYGHLYNSYVKDGARQVCPSGWHVATPEDWNKVGSDLGGSGVAGDKMKEQGTKHWSTANVSTNSSGFTGMPAGSLHNGGLADVGTDGYWWSTGANDFYYLTNTLPELRHKSSAALHEALSIRCVKD